MNDHNYIAVEGIIGVGKTDLSSLLAEKLKARLVLENPEENPFLLDFYNEKKRYAFQTQIFFLLSRYKQQQNFLEHDLFMKKVISDYFFEKDKIFASVNLDEKELFLYERIYSLLIKNVPKPDLILYLQSDPQTLYKKLRRKRKKQFQKIELDYLLALNEAYNRYFFHYDETPLLILNSDDFDFQKNPSHLDELLELLKKPQKGRRYYVRR
ncbi:MAG: deoxyadenosine kinase [candidate division Zixibacteria bacterium SM23_73_2]|nr:MAG: deoxyadenosine kinase [candidate division Zixibacteria bacterium SM23_73_2]